MHNANGFCHPRHLSVLISISLLSLQLWQCIWLLGCWTWLRGQGLPSFVVEGHDIKPSFAFYNLLYVRQDEGSIQKHLDLSIIGRSLSLTRCIPAQRQGWGPSPADAH